MTGNYLAYYLLVLEKFRFDVTRLGEGKFVRWVKNKLKLVMFGCDSFCCKCFARRRFDIFITPVSPLAGINTTLPQFPLALQIFVGKSNLNVHHLKIVTLVTLYNLTIYSQISHLKSQTLS